MVGGGRKRNGEYAGVGREKANGGGEPTIEICRQPGVKYMSQRKETGGAKWMEMVGGLSLSATDGRVYMDGSWRDGR